MIRTISKIGNSPGLIFDTELCELTGLKAGDQVNSTVHDPGSIILTPLRKSAAPTVIESTIQQSIKEYGTTQQKLT